MLTDTDKKDIVALFAELIDDACVSCPLNETARGELTHIMGMTKDLGDGDYGRGIEVIRKNQQFVVFVREKIHQISVKTGNTVLYIIITAILGAAGWILTPGIKEALKKLVE